MSKYLIDAPVSLGMCSNCSAYVFSAMVGGLSVTVDPAPLDVLGVRDALIAGRAVYEQLAMAGRPWMLRLRTPDSQWPSQYAILGEHPCAGRARGVQVTPIKTTARANVSKGWDSDARAIHATHATHHHSETYLYRRCEKCGKFIGLDRDLIGVWYRGYWDWVQHMKCEE